MNYLYSALILHKSGQDVTEDGVSAVLKAAGVKADSSRVKALVAALSDVNIDEALESAVMAAPAVAGSVAVPAAATEEAVSEEEEGEEVEEEGLGSLFG